MVRSINAAMRIHVHDDARVLDGMLALVALARVARPLEDTLSAMCALVAELTSADIASVYLREQRPDGDVLVMHGNIGFPRHAVGHVELRLSEGLTGVVAERRRPVTVAIAQADERYKHVDGIGEEHFPAYLGLPLMNESDVAGVLVLQRRAPAMFTPSDIALASSLTAPFMFVIERGPRLPRRCFSGVAQVAGSALGAAAVLPAYTDCSALPDEAALHALEHDLIAAARRIGHGRSPQVTRALDNLGLLTTALRERVRVAAPHDDVIAALERAPYRTVASEKGLGARLDARHAELVDLWSFLAADDQRRLTLDGGVLVAPRLGTFLALEAIARGVAAVVVATAIEPEARAVLHAAELPAVTAVPELAACLRGGEVLEVDGDRGSVRIVALPR